MVQDNAENSKYAFGTAVVSFISNNSTYFIDPTNTDDPLEDGSLDHPYSSWKNVSWTDGYYYLQKSGTKAYESDILIGADSVTLGAYGNGALPIINSNSATYVFKGYNKKYVNIQDLNIIGNQAQSCIYFLGSDCKNITIERCILEGAAMGVRVVDGKDLLIKYNTFKNPESGVYSMAENTQVYYNIFKNSQTAVNLASYLTEANIYNNVFYGNVQGVSSSYSKLTLYNNIFYLTRSGDLAVSQKLDSLISDNNIYYPEQKGFIEIGSQKFDNLSDLRQKTNAGLSSFSADPLFEDAANDDFTIEFNSPAIDKGKDVGLNTDFYGYKVPSGGIPDIGIAEILDNMAESATNVRSIQNNDPDNSFMAYPNPTTGELHIKCNNNPVEGTNGSTELKVTNISGKLVYYKLIDKFFGTEEHSIDLSALPRGFYFLIMNMGGSSSTQKIILK